MPVMRAASREVPTIRWALALCISRGMARTPFIACTAPSSPGPLARWCPPAASASSTRITSTFTAASRLAAGLSSCPRLAAWPERYVPANSGQCDVLRRKWKMPCSGRRARTPHQQARPACSGAVIAGHQDSIPSISRPLKRCLRQRMKPIPTSSIYFLSATRISVVQ
jgi:hypothetical protein